MKIIQLEFTEQECQQIVNLLNIASLHPQHGGLEVSRIALPIADKIVTTANRSEPASESEKVE